MLHAKIMTVDGIVANVGSANLNARSTTLDEEINIVAIDPELTEILDRHSTTTSRAAFVWKRPMAGSDRRVQRIVEAAVTPIKRFF